MNSKVRVTANEAGSVIKVSEKNPEYGSVKIEQTKIMFKKNGWVQKKRLTALLHGSVEELKSMNFFNGQELPGNIVITEQLEPFNSEDPDKDFKVAGDTGIVCCVDGEPIYRTTSYDQDPLSTDYLVQHTNGEDIKDAYLKDLDNLMDQQKEKINKKENKKEEITKEENEEEILEEDNELSSEDDAQFTL